MMSRDKHSPLPWRYEYDGNHARILQGNDEWSAETIAELSVYRENTEANAAYLVKAANSYPALVEALEIARDTYHHLYFQEGKDYLKHLENVERVLALAEKGE